MMNILKERFSSERMHATQATFIGISWAVVEQQRLPIPGKRKGKIRHRILSFGFLFFRIDYRMWQMNI